ncbi:MAG: pseudouridine-5'-phosphate glycosidase [Bacteroidales bacterium]|nr:pseudouridine-5'-phosphate glycosidase [Bacteroidales bacterium]
MNKYIEFNEEVLHATENEISIVALESTIISHGMPYPKNVETAMRCEAIVRENGSVPATIAILNGKLKVGLSKDELNYLGKTGTQIVKTSRRDIAVNVANKIDGATTVSATMYIASLAGIKVFATGGIGGVHRGAETSFDISADLEELAITNVLVVCAGIKSILDLGLTMEYLETKGVPVIGYQTKKLPAFYSRTSDFNVNFQIDTPKEIANVLKTKLALSLNGGMLVTNPIPEEYSLENEFINKAIDQALLEMDQLGIKGKEQTPYLLGKVVELTDGKSLESNIALVYNNCQLASKISAELNALTD